jgi:hypothetical protein
LRLITDDDPARIQLHSPVSKCSGPTRA